MKYFSYFSQKTGYLIYKSPWYFLSSFELIGLSVQKFKIDFQDGDGGDHIGFSVRTSLVLFFFYLQVTQILPTKFPLNWSFGSGEAQNRFPRWRPSWISDRNNFNYFFFLFFIYKSPWCFLPSFQSIGLLVQEKKRKINVQDGGHYGFPVGTILPMFDLVVTPMLPTKFKVNWPFISGEEANYRFSRWRPSWISNWNDFS